MKPEWLFLETRLVPICFSAPYPPGGPVRQILKKCEQGLC
uniref:Uncharacterized protein n=1 Tax=Faecalibaculum rodentium TaxID=1702221 RepID=A0A140DXX6_9FIRM|nr:hypothetical protein AALO17_23690 [Faecalibaculum rodentium]